MKPRETQLDILRLAAFAGVVFTHAARGYTGALLSLFTAVVTWHVPVFVMLSGRFFLEGDSPRPPRKLLAAVTRLGIAWLFWNTAYQLYYFFSGAYAGLNYRGILTQWLSGAYHLWFLPVLMCLYAAVPLLNKLLARRRTVQIYLLLFFAFGFLAQGENRPAFVLPLAFSGYFVMGACLHRYPLTPGKEAAIYGAGIFCLILTGTAALLSPPGEEWFCRYLMPNVILESAAVFTFFSRRVRKTAAPRISALARCSFGGYLVHAFVLEWLDALPVVLPLLPRTALACLLSLTVAALLRKLPRVGNYIA